VVEVRIVVAAVLAAAADAVHDRKGCHCLAPVLELCLTG
jgi:hypothetical protein